jgi:hypothetical protein
VKQKGSSLFVVRSSVKVEASFSRTLEMKGATSNQEPGTKNEELEIHLGFIISTNRSRTAGHSETMML